MTNKPKVLYKYTTAEVGLKILETQTIRFSNPKTFNDPYDSDMPIVFENPKKLTKEYFIRLSSNTKKYARLGLNERNLLNDVISLLKNDSHNFKLNPNSYLAEALKPFKQDMRILSLSNNNSNILMWGHYANSHKGIVIGFNTTEMFFRHPRKINYANDIPKLGSALINDLILTKDESLEEFKMLLQTKSADWKYEEEYRCIFSVHRNYTFFSKNPSVCKMHPNYIKELKNKENFIHQPFSSKCLNSVYIGLNTNIIDCHKIVAIVRNKYPQAKIYRAFLSENEFKVEFEEIIK